MYLCIYTYIHTYIHIHIPIPIHIYSLAALHLMISVIGLFLQDLATECRKVPRIAFYSGNFLLFFYSMRACAA